MRILRSEKTKTQLRRALGRRQRQLVEALTQGSKSWICYRLAVGHSASGLTSLCLGFLICQMGIISSYLLPLL